MCKPTPAWIQNEASDDKDHPEVLITLQPNQQAQQLHQQPQNLAPQQQPQQPVPQQPVRFQLPAIAIGGAPPAVMIQQPKSHLACSNPWLFSGGALPGLQFNNLNSRRVCSSLRPLLGGGLPRLQPNSPNNPSSRSACNSPPPSSCPGSSSLTNKFSSLSSIFNSLSFSGKFQLINQQHCTQLISDLQSQTGKHIP